MKTSTTSEVKTINLSAIESELRPKSTEELRFHFFDCYNGAAKLIAEAAICVKLMQERGENLNGIPLVGTFRRIAAGQILPELVWKFIESPGRQDIERLPLDDQKRLVSNSMVPVVEPKPEGGFSKRMVDMTKAPRDVVRLVAGPEGIRPVEEQMAYIGARKAAIAIKPKDEEEQDIKEPLSRQITVKLTETEYEALKIRAALSRCKEQEIARRGLLQSGYLKKPKT